MRRKLRKLPLVMTALALLGIASLGPIWRTTGIIIVRNTSPSMPYGFYLVQSARTISRGDLVVFQLPQTVKQEMSGFRWIGRLTLLLKQVAAIQGDVVCSRGGKLFINDTFIADSKKDDSEGRLIPVFRGCFTVGESKFLPISTRIPNSFDGRYFGAVSEGEIVGSATPIITWD